MIQTSPSSSYSRGSWIMSALNILFISLLCLTAFGSADNELSPDDFTKMEFDVENLVNYHSQYPTTFEKHSRNAYVLIHYENTPNDNLYILGTQIVIRSIKETGTTQDIIVVCADNVAESSKQIFMNEGARIKVVPNIPNPYKATQQRRRTYKSRFEFTFNKLYMWNLLEYERVLYMDADNLVTRNMDELFLCGHYCVTFFNPLFFHTGMMVVKPSAPKFKELVGNLLSLASFSYDGADQGFLTAEFPHVEAAPLFSVENALQTASPVPVPSEEPAMRFNMEYNMNSVYFYPYMSWDFYRRVGLSFSHAGEGDLDNLPVASIDYCIGPVLKPWNWLPYVFFHTVKYWDAVRMRAPNASDVDAGMLWPALLSLTFVLALANAARAVSRRQASALSAVRRVARAVVAKLPARLLAAVLALISLLAAVAVIVKIPLIVPPVYAWPCIYAAILVLFYATINLFALIIAPPGPVGDRHSYGTRLHELSSLFLSLGAYQVTAPASRARRMASPKATVDSMADDSDVNEFDEELEMEMGAVVVAQDADGYMPVGGAKVARPIGSVDGSVLRSGLSFNVVLLPMLVCLLLIYVSRSAMWHFHFAEKMVFLVASLMSLVGSMGHAFYRVILLAFNRPQASGVITLR